jgi:hypothetical protein
MFSPCPLHIDLLAQIELCIFKKGIEEKGLEDASSA